MIKAIIFDCFGVLSNVNLWQEYLATLENKEQIEEAKELNRMCDAGLISRDDFFQKVQQLTGKPLHDVESLTGTDSIKNRRLLEYIKELKKSYKIGLLSNVGSNWIRDEFLNREEQELFDTMVMSYEVGMTKPDPEIFTLSCDRLAVRPSEAIFVDDIESYCIAAANIGMSAVIYQSFEQCKQELDQILSRS